MTRYFYLHFLKQRTKFIRMYYSGARMGFAETMRKIQDSESPYDVAPWSESDEPPFLDEWIEARDANRIVGESCVSMLSASLKLFLAERFGAAMKLNAAGEKIVKRKGYLLGYKAVLAEAGLSIEDAPVNYRLLEEIELVRNRTQHPENITDMNARYSPDVLKKIPSPIFVGEDELAMAFKSQEGKREWLVPPAVEVTPETMERAIAEVDTFCEWLDNWLVLNFEVLRAAAVDSAIQAED